MKSHLTLIRLLKYIKEFLFETYLKCNQIKAPNLTTTKRSTSSIRSDNLEPWNFTRLIGFAPEREWFRERKKEHSENNADEIGDGVLEGGSGGLEESQLVGDLFGGARGKRDGGSEKDAEAAEDRVAGFGGEEREDDGEGEAEEDVLELVWGQPVVAIVHEREREREGREVFGNFFGGKYNY